MGSPGDVATPAALDVARFRVATDGAFRLTDIDPADTQGLTDKGAARDALAANRRRAAELQQRLYAESTRAVLLVLQAMDTGGKDSTIRHITAGINPQGCRVVSFKAPCRHELARDFLWRIHKEVPAKGTITIFNRSHYEDVLIVRVHGWAPADLIEARYEHINAFEALLADHGTRVIKVMLHISSDYQLERLRRRLRRPDKHWKFNPDDLKERERWDEYMAAYETALQRCSTPHAPWYVVPAETRWFRDLVASQILVNTLEHMAPRLPPADFDVTAFRPEALR